MRFEGGSMGVGGPAPCFVDGTAHIADGVSGPSEGGLHAVHGDAPVGLRETT